jgi:hypothetical protein
MGVLGYSIGAEGRSGDLGGELDEDFVGFLKKLETDLFGGGCCGRERARTCG